jgi:hypothetical protein
LRIIARGWALYAEALSSTKRDIHRRLSLLTYGEFRERIASPGPAESLFNECDTEDGILEVVKMSLPLGAPRSATCKMGRSNYKYTAQPYGTFSIPLSTSLDSEQISSLLLRRKQLSIRTTLIPIYSKSSDRAAWLTGYSVQVATTGLNKLSRQLVVKRLGCQDIRSSKHK